MACPLLRTGNGYKLLVAQQRGWSYAGAGEDCEALDDTAGGLNAKDEPNRTRIWIYDPATREWGHVGYELAPLPADASWVGLSEITEVDDGYILIERDNRTGDFAALKTLVWVAKNAFVPGGLIEQSDKRVFDLQPALKASNGWISDKPEGVAVTPSGRTFVVTDNDGVDEWSGETWFVDLGAYQHLFAR